MDSCVNILLYLSCTAAPHLEQVYNFSCIVQDIQVCTVIDKTEFLYLKVEIHKKVELKNMTSGCLKKSLSKTYSKPLFVLIW